MKTNDVREHQACLRGLCSHFAARCHQSALAPTHSLISTSTSKHENNIKKIDSPPGMSDDVLGINK